MVLPKIPEDNNYKTIGQIFKTIFQVSGACCGYRYSKQYFSWSTRKSKKKKYSRSPKKTKKTLLKYNELIFFKEHGF